MIHFAIGQSKITTNIRDLKKFANDLYYHYSNSQRNKKQCLSDEKYPNIKITDDIFSVQLWVKANNGEEKRVFLDGDVFLNSMVIHTITIEGQKLTEAIYREISRLLRKLTEIGKGFCDAEVDKTPIRFEEGKMVS